MKTEEPVFVCSHIFERSRPVMLVVHDDGDWQALCGDAHASEKPRVIGMNHLLQRDIRLRELLDLPDGWEAERSSPAGPWERRAINK